MNVHMTYANNNPYTQSIFFRFFLLFIFRGFLVNVQSMFLKILLNARIESNNTHPAKEKSDDCTLG